MTTPFANILRVAVEQTPGAIAGAFAAGDGEIVDLFIPSEPTDWAVLTAHYGIVLAHVQAALLTFHYGEAKMLTFSHTNTDILMHPVTAGYFALMAVGHPAPWGKAISALNRAATALRVEMG